MTARLRRERVPKGVQRGRLRFRDLTPIIARDPLGRDRAAWRMQRQRYDEPAHRERPRRWPQLISSHRDPMMIEPGQHRMDSTRLPAGCCGCPVEQQPVDRIEEHDVSAFLRRGKGAGNWGCLVSRGTDLGQNGPGPASDLSCAL